MIVKYFSIPPLAAKLVMPSDLPIKTVTVPIKTHIKTIKGVHRNIFDFGRLNSNLTPCLPN